MPGAPVGTRHSFHPAHRRALSPRLCPDSHPNQIRSALAKLSDSLSPPAPVPGAAATARAGPPLDGHAAPATTAP